MIPALVVELDQRLSLHEVRELVLIVESAKRREEAFRPTV